MDTKLARIGLVQYMVDKYRVTRDTTAATIDRYPAVLALASNSDHPDFEAMCRFLGERTLEDSIKGSKRVRAGFRTEALALSATDGAGDDSDRLFNAAQDRAAREGVTFDAALQSIRSEDPTLFKAGMRANDLGRSRRQRSAEQRHEIKASIAGGDPEAVAQFLRLTEQRCQKRGIAFGRALEELRLEQPGLWRRASQGMRRPGDRR